jgi:pantothenate kinase type III
LVLSLNTLSQVVFSFYIFFRLKLYASIDGMAERIADELRTPSIPIVLTGGLGKIVAPWCRTKIHFEPNLLLIGLQILYDMNVRKEGPRE